MATMDMASSLAKKAKDASIVGNNGACSNGRGGENKCNNSALPIAKGRVCSM